MFKTKYVIAAVVGLFVLSAIGVVNNCAYAQSGHPQPPSVKDVQAQKAKQAAESIRFSSNAEIENIKSRLELTSKPGLIGYILLLNETGQPVMYTSTKGKVTSGGKRLTQPQALERLKYRNSNGDVGYSYEVVNGPSDEGTYGSSNPYIYFWTTSGQYIQWSGKYLWSDKPFRTSIKPLVVDIQGK